MNWGGTSEEKETDVEIRLDFILRRPNVKIKFNLKWIGDYTKNLKFHHIWILDFMKSVEVWSLHLSSIEGNFDSCLDLYKANTVAVYYKTTSYVIKLKTFKYIVFNITLIQSNFFKHFLVFSRDTWHNLMASPNWMSFLSQKVAYVWTKSVDEGEIAHTSRYRIHVGYTQYGVYPWFDLHILLSSNLSKGCRIFWKTCTTPTPGLTSTS